MTILLTDLRNSKQRISTLNSLNYMNRFLPTLVLVIVISMSSFATHIMSNHIEFRALDTFKFEVKYTFYRDCRSVAFSLTSVSNTIRCATGGASKTLNLKLASIEEVTRVGDSYKGCSPANTYGTGEGVEKHVYLDTIDLNDSN